MKALVAYASGSMSALAYGMLAAESLSEIS